MNISEKELLKEICQKYEINFEVFLELIAIEKEYTDKNMTRRAGIYKRLKEQLSKEVRW